MKTALHLTLLATLLVPMVRSEDAAALQEKVATLERRVAELAGEKSKEKRLETLREDARQKARKRSAEDRQTYSPEQLREIETLYQVANAKGKRTEEAKASLKQLLEKYDKANRTGCALLYLGQASEGQERIDYLTRAVEKFSDCYYLNGCQVGGYGRYLLSLTLAAAGSKEKATQLLNELKTEYKDAIGHDGKPMADYAAAVEKELSAGKS